MISSFFMAMVSNTVFLEFFNNSWIWKIEKNSYVFLNLTFYVRNVPNQSKKSNNYWNLFLSILFLVRNFAHFLYYLFLLIGCQNIDCSCTFFLRHMSCLNKSNMKLHLIPSIARCASSSFSVWRNMKNIYIFFRRKSLTRHTLPLMKLGEISYLTYLGIAYASKKKGTRAINILIPD